MLKKLFLAMGKFFIILLISTLLLTIIHYFNWLKPEIIGIIKFLIPIISIFIASFWLGRECEKKGYLEGLKLGVVIVFVFWVIVFLLDKVSMNSFVYYLILILTSILSSMVGINRKSKR